MKFSWIWSEELSSAINTRIGGTTTSKFSWYLWCVLRPSPYLLISQATRPFISMTSEGLANPRRLSTRFLHLSLSICRTVRAFFSSRLAVRTSAAIWKTHTHAPSHHATMKLNLQVFQGFPLGFKIFNWTLLSVSFMLHEVMPFITPTIAVMKWKYPCYLQRYIPPTAYLSSCLPSTFTFTPHH